MNERQVMEYMEQVSAYGIVPGLDSIRELCRELGDPQKELRFVHIAGTNGKGSVSAFLAEILKCAGYRVGRYLSPTLFQYRERIQVNGSCITKAALGRGVERIKGICDGMVARGLSHPTPFEIETALGFLYFREKACDVVVLETGMGGLLDATNIVENTLAAVLTSVSMDHMQFLGDTPEKIAFQKAGIIKRGCRVVSAVQRKEVLEVIRAGAEAMGCPLQAVKPEMLSHVRYGLEKQSFDYGRLKKLELSLAGKYQIENAALAVETVEALGEQGLSVSEEALRLGLSRTQWPGRFTLIGKKPYFIVDGAHNEEAAVRLAESLEFYFTNKRVIYIMGVLKDKEYEKIIASTHALADQIITVTPPGNPRALPAYELARAVAEVHCDVTAADSLEEAVEMSRLLAGKEDVIVAFGSLSFLGRLMKIAGYGKVS
ncbi:folylpolyglutamate synthase [Lachnospiraceae bacterium]|jgi:dihydrofolate synthase/folylpolyglutamate synthase|nr:bifunctional folylpolyglutamate synthase/dihydrofolate synthase [Lachnospiraceae bacterium]GFI66368.1 folylpolyglutamate synthase [Lachnospiraceae bacterium]